MHLRNLLVTLAGAVLAFGCGGGSTSGSDAGPAAPAKMSQLGESCSRSADCEGDLICVSQQCAASGTTTTAPKVSGRGETCTSSTDCATGMVCWGAYDATNPYLTLGRCDYASFGIEATGKTCSAECNTAADCLEIPIPDQAGPPAYKSCEDLAAAIPSGTDCSSTTTFTRECFLRGTYCNTGGTNPWACTNGACVFGGSCVSGKAGEVFGGCPLYTRSGTSLAVTTCNATTLKCTATTTTGCTTDASCTGKAVADDAADSCSSDECVCHVASGGCYRRCRNDLECAHGYVCGTSQYCVAANTCDSDAFCATSTGHAFAKCDSGKCKLPCTNDLDCSPSGLFATSPVPFNGQVCSAGFCASVGCSSNAECSITSGGQNVKLFCVTPPDAAATAAPHSAITN